MSDTSQGTEPGYFLKQVLQLGINGAPGLSNAKELGDKYLNNPSFETKLDRIDALVKWEGRKNFTSGFITSLGGIITLPISIPASLGVNWILQTRMVAAMAHIGGFDIDEAPVRMSIALCLLGKRGKEILNQNFGNIESYFKKRGLNSIPTKTLSIVNQAIATKLMQIAAQKGMSRVSKAIPLVGGMVGGLLDYQSCRESAEFARELFQFHLGIELPDKQQSFD
ncbi:EcsC family protein [bacterium]|nr:EcsC family protein [bacterium]